MNKRPLVSVIMNCYNSDQYLREAIDSVMAQSYETWEIVFWDNQSTDNSAEIVHSYNDDRIKYFYAPTFEPLYGARNFAIEKATGEYITFLDCDDTWLEKKLELQLQFLHGTDYPICYSNYFNLNNGELKKIFHKEQPSGNIFKYQISHYSIGILTVMLTKGSWEIMNEKFNKNYNFPGDFDFFIRYLENNKAIYINECLCVYRLDNPNSISNTKQQSNIDEIKEVITNFKSKYKSKDILKAIRQLEINTAVNESSYLILNNMNCEARKISKKYLFESFKCMAYYLLTFFDKKYVMYAKTVLKKLRSIFNNNK